jgi:mono/diheme cytochrome c family protein
MSTSLRAAVLTVFSLSPLSFAQPPQGPAAPNVPFSSSRVAFTQTGGETLYRAVCQGCHMAQGQGAKGAGFYPALASNPRLASPGYPVHVVLNGLHGMPGFADRLNDEQVADVVNHIRTHFGNAYGDPVKATDVQAYRKK